MNPAIRILILLGGVLLAIQYYWLNYMMTSESPPVIFNYPCMFIIITLITFVIPNWFGRKGVERLEAQAIYLSLMQRRLVALKLSRRCIEWLERVNDVQRNEVHIKAGYDGCGLNYLEKLNFNYKADEMMSKADDLISQGDTFLQPENHLQGTMNSYMKEVIGFIKATSGNSGGLLGIWGLGGVGKSSLLQLVLDSRRQYDNGYLKVMFVCAGIATTVGQVQRDIATSMGLPIERDETSQGKIIHEHLHGTSFLLLLDDLWEYLDLEAVGIPSPLGMVISSLHGCLQRKICRKVVLTTRARAKCDQMGCRNNTIQMKSFAEEDVLELYRTGSSGWPGVIEDGGDEVDVDLPGQKSSSGGSSPRSQLLTWPHLHTVRDVQPQDPQDLLPGVTRYYKQVSCFTEAEGSQSLLLGFWGMRGVGKTTLLRLVRDSYTGNACFDHIMFVGAGSVGGVTSVQDAIAINLGFDLDMISSSSEFLRAEYIFNYLEHKSFLLILDDIREPFNWWAIGLPTLSHKQQKIILATRTRAACALMGCHAVNTIQVKCLGKDDAWNLFRDKVGLGIMDNHLQVHHLAKKMVLQCGGLPLALCALGRAMSNKKDPREWRSAYNCLRALHLEPFEIDDKAITSILNSL